MEEDEIYGDAVIFGREDLVKALHGEHTEEVKIQQIDPRAFDDV